MDEDDKEVVGGRAMIWTSVISVGLYVKYEERDSGMGKKGQSWKCDFV